MSRRRSKQIPSHVGKTIVAHKTPRADPQFDTGDGQTPAWLIRDIDQDGPFGWNALEKAPFLDEVLPALKAFESMTWGEILGRNNHLVSVESLCKEARKRLQERKLDDIEQLVSLRLGGTKRVWGIRSQRVLRILWWDPKHVVCPSPKKHT